jgi:hypothetical protein
MGVVDGLCCASLRNVSDTEQDLEGGDNDHIRKFFTSYDLNHLDHAAGETSFASNSILEDDALSRKDSFHMSNKATSKEGTETTSDTVRPLSALLHTVVPTSFLPQDYGRQILPEKNQFEIAGDEDSCCHSCPQLMFLSDDHRQPHPLSPSDTYTTVSMSQSYMWDEGDEDEDDMHTLVPTDSVFRRDETQESSSLSPIPFTAKTHEAYEYLLRMKPQNYIHKTSSDDFEYNNHCGFFLYYEDSTSASPAPAVPHLEEMG